MYSMRFCWLWLVHIYSLKKVLFMPWKEIQGHTFFTESLYLSMCKWCVKAFNMFKGHNWFAQYTCNSNPTSNLQLDYLLLMSPCCSHESCYCMLPYLHGSIDRLLIIRIRIDHRNQQFFLSINQLLPIIGTSLPLTWVKIINYTFLV